MTRPLRLDRSIAIAAAIAGLLVLGWAPERAAAQLAGRSLLRLEAGMLNPDDPLQITLAFGAAAGWQVDRSDAFLLRYVRQSQNRNTGEAIGRQARGLLTANWEHAFGARRRYQRQAMIRLGVGALFRYKLATAPLASTSLELRYEVYRRIAFVASIEDDIGNLPRQDFQYCQTDLFGNNPVCTTQRYGGHLQHNYGFIVGAEWSP